MILDASRNPRQINGVHVTNTMNTQGTSEGSITVALPEERRRSPNYPFAFIDPPLEPYDPRRPEPTYTFWKKANDTFPLGEVVYFIYCAGRIKIGITVSLHKRLETIRSHSPLPAVAVLVVSGGLPAERGFHRRFAAEREHREWFTLSQQMRQFFRARLCPIGRATLKRAEAEFNSYCAQFNPI